MVIMKEFFKKENIFHISIEMTKKSKKSQYAILLEHEVFTLTRESDWLTATELANVTATGMWN